ncbi:signal peptidase I [Pseudobutyrivibrio sp.]
MKKDSKCGGNDMGGAVKPKLLLCIMKKIVATMPFLLFAWAFLRIFLFDQFVIHSSSMEPTIRPGDRVFVNKSIIGARIYTSFNFDKHGSELKSVRMRGLRGLRHDDIVVFNFPFHSENVSFVLNDVYIKRCIGLPGDSIGIVNGVYINNNVGHVGLSSSQLQLSRMRDCEIDSTILTKKHKDFHYVWTIKNMPSLYIPRKGDIIHITAKEGYLYQRVLEWETGKKLIIDWENNDVHDGCNILRTHRFLHDYVFVVGDNSLNSLDSRYWGVVPVDYIVGVVGGLCL